MCARSENGRSVDLDPANVSYRLALAVFFLAVLIPVMLTFRIPIIGFFKAIKEPALPLASVFVAQAAGIDLTVGQQVTMLLTLMLTSKGVAGVPRAALVILAATLASFHLPIEGVALVLGVDALMDMGRTMTNVIGNCLAAVVVAKWEGEFREPAPEAAS